MDPGSRGEKDVSSYKVHGENLRPPKQRRGNYKNILDLGGIWIAKVRQSQITVTY